MGSGCGLVGLCLGCAESQVFLTDLEPLLPQLNHNIEINLKALNFQQNQVQAVALPWGTSNIPQELKSSNIDFILASDCLWVDYLVEDFVKTLHDLSSLHLTQGENTSTSPIIYISHEQRAKKTEEHFVNYASQYFKVETVPFLEMNSEYRNPYILIFRLTLKQ